MERLHSTPRPDSAEKLQSIGLSFHALDNYWKEDTAYKFSAAQIDTIEVATEELHSMCLDAVAHVLRTDSLDRLGIPFSAHESIHASWKLQEPSLYGRFDLAYDGSSLPKMLEYNADTPTSLLESAVAQWYWLQDTHPQADQFNSLHEKLVARWQAMGINGPLHVASLRDNEEDWVCTHYLIETAIQAGLAARHLHIEDIGWDAANRSFVDQQNKPISTVFKLYPWEWLFQEDFGLHLTRSSTKFIEPAWKAVLSCKGILPLLWEQHQGHPNLLPAFFEPGKLQSFAKKPLFSREGANVQLHRDGVLVSDACGPYGAEGHIYQQLVEMPCFDGQYPVIGSWIVGNEAAGMCIREDGSPVTTNMSHFVPHFFLK
jgi:glutathionylspermidine synthase